MLCGVFFVFQITLSIICFPLSTFCSLLFGLFKISLLLARSLVKCLTKACSYAKNCCRPRGIGCRRRREDRQAIAGAHEGFQPHLGFEWPRVAIAQGFPVYPAQPPQQCSRTPRDPRPAPRNNRRRARSPRS